MTSATTTQKHAFGTRLFHIGLALAIIVQLVSSQFMIRPRSDRPANTAFWVHEYAGIAALLFAFGFWVVLASRSAGTAPGLLVPWFSATRLRAVWADLRTYLSALKSRRLPTYEEHSPMVSAIHGFGLLLMSGMAATGLLYYLTATPDGKTPALVHLLMEAHSLFGNVVWAYLILHAGMAVIHHVTRDLDLREMWSLRR
jgi:cytochrome b561